MELLSEANSMYKEMDIEAQDIILQVYMYEI